MCGSSGRASGSCSRRAMYRKPASRDVEMLADGSPLCAVGLLRPGRAGPYLMMLIPVLVLTERSTVTGQIAPGAGFVSLASTVPACLRVHLMQS